MSRKNNNKVIPIICRTKGAETEILVFRHPLAGIQFIKGTVEENENLEFATLRELNEESGINHAFIDRYLGVHSPTEQGPDWHVFLCKTEVTLPEKWQHFCHDDGGLVFSLFWFPISARPTSEWHPVFQELLQFVQQKMINSNI